MFYSYNFKKIVTVLLCIITSFFTVSEAQVKYTCCIPEKNSVRVCFEDICNTSISKSQLPQLRKLTLCTRIDSIEIIEYDLLIQKDSGYSTFKLKQPEFPVNVRKSIMELQNNQFIIVENVKVMTHRYGRRSVEGGVFIIKNYEDNTVMPKN